jgi:hypothetical protein
MEKEYGKIKGGIDPIKNQFLQIKCNMQIISQNNVMISDKICHTCTWHVTVILPPFIYTR